MQLTLTQVNENKVRIGNKTPAHATLLPKTRSLKAYLRQAKSSPRFFTLRSAS